MNKPDVETIGNPTDKFVLPIAVLLAIGGLFGFSFWSEWAMVARIGVLLGGVAAGLGLAWLTQPGKRFIAFAQESAEEAKRVTWPSGKETAQTTWVVFGFVAIMSLLLFFVDKVIEWGLYDVILGWKR
jgi:preprotein translocase subunit SecE